MVLFCFKYYPNLKMLKFNTFNTIDLKKKTNKNKNNSIDLFLNNSYIRNSISIFTKFCKENYLLNSTKKFSDNYKPLSSQIHNENNKTISLLY